MTERKYPTITEAQEALQAASLTNPGRWIGHCEHAALAARLIAERCPSLDAEKAYILGLLHDIGRWSGVVGERHNYDGYRYCMERGWEDVARICMTHSFMIKDCGSVLGVWDTTPEEDAFMKEYIDNVEYDDYDLLIQLCDNLAYPERLCIIEERLVDVTRRYGVNQYTQERFNKVFEIKERFDAMVGGSIYDNFPGLMR